MHTEIYAKVSYFCIERGRSPAVLVLTSLVGVLLAGPGARGTTLSPTTTDDG